MLWLNHATEVSIEKPRLDPTQPQYEMTGLHAVQFDRNGGIRQQISGSKAWQLPNTDFVQLDGVAGKTYAEGKTLYEVTAPNAQYNTVTQALSLNRPTLLNPQGNAVAQPHSDTSDGEIPNAATGGQAPFKSRIRAVIYEPPQP